jgi:branched-chain amino acid transport system permease protein
MGVIAIVFAFLQFTTFGMVVRAGMRDRETVGLLGIHIERRFTIVFGIAVVVAGIAGAMYTPIVSPNYRIGMDFLVLSFVVVVVGGMGSLGGAFLASLLIGVVQTFAVAFDYSLLMMLQNFGVQVSSAMQNNSFLKLTISQVAPILPYLFLVLILIFRPKGLLGTRET